MRYGPDRLPGLIGRELTIDVVPQAAGGCPAARGGCFGNCSACPFIRSAETIGRVDSKAAAMATEPTAFKPEGRLAVLPGGIIPIKRESSGLVCISCGKNPCQCEEKAA